MTAPLDILTREELRNMTPREAYLWLMDHRDDFVMTREELFANSETVEKFIDRDDRDTSGIYFLFVGDELVYVGQAVYIRRRVSVHFNDPFKHFDRVAAISCPAACLDDIESFYICIFTPPQNKRIPVMSEIFEEIV